MNNPARLNPWRLEPVDLRRFIRLGVKHIYAGAIDPRRAWLPFVRFNLADPPPTWARHEYWGSPHMVGRFLDALALASHAVDAPHDEAAVDGLRKLVHDCLDNPAGLPFDTLPDEKGERAACMHHCREVLQALVALARWRRCERSLELARRFVRTIEEVTRPSGGFPSSVLAGDGWRKPEPGQTNSTTGRLIGALTEYYRFTKDGLALDLARRFADRNIEAAFTPDGDLTDGAGGHLHSTEGTMASLLDLGALAAEPRYVALGRRLYDNGLRAWRTSYGWAKESRDPQPGRGEANNTGDFIEAALALALNGEPRYFADAERIVRNGLLAAQVVETDWIVQSSEADTEDYAHTRICERARGAFAFTSPNGYHSYNTDLMGGALRALCKAHQAIVSADGGRCTVNLLFSADTPALTVRSRLPSEGRLDVRANEPCRLRVRVGENADPGTVALCAKGRRGGVPVVDGVADAGPVARGEDVTLTFDVPRRRTSEEAPGWGPSQIDWLGSTIAGMTPAQGPIALY